MRAKITTLSSHLLSGKMAGAVDADCSLRRMLSELKDDLNCIRRDPGLCGTPRSAAAAPASGWPRQSRS
jgi:hypothetical protein